MTTTGVLLIIGSLITLLTAIISFFEKKKSLKKSREGKIYNIISICFISIGILFTLIVGLYSDSKNKKNEDLTAKFQKEVQSKSDSIIKIQNQNKEETKNLNRELVKAKNTLIGIQTEAINQITGDNNKPLLIVRFSKLAALGIDTTKKYFNVFFDLINISKYPLRDISVTLNDVYGREMMKYFKPIRHGNNDYTYDGKSNTAEYENYQFFKDILIGALAPKRRLPIYTTTIKIEDANPSFKSRYTIDVAWSEGVFKYTLYCASYNNRLFLTNVELLFNEKKIDYKKHIVFQESN